MIWHPEKSVILCEIPESTKVHALVWIGKDVKIGENCKIQPQAFIPDGVGIGNNVFIGPRVTFTNDKYPPSNGRSWMKTVVEDNVSIGAGAIILPGITIKKGAKIGAGALVTKDVPENELWTGSPARKYERK